MWQKVEKHVWKHRGVSIGASANATANANTNAANESVPIPIGENANAIGLTEDLDVPLQIMREKDTCFAFTYHKPHTTYHIPHTTYHIPHTACKESR